MEADRMMKIRRFGRLALLIAMATCLARTARAEQNLDFTIRPVASVPRGGAPIVFDVSFTLTTERRDPQVLQGHLVIVFSENGQELYRWAGPDMAIAKGSQDRRILLPMAVSSRDSGVVEMNASFVSRRRTWQLDPSLLTGGASGSRRNFVRMECMATRLTPEVAQLVNTLRLEAFEPGENGRPLTGPSELARTTRAMLRPAQMHVDPLEYCAYDIVALDSQALELMRPEQRAALTTWLKGGGSVLVLATEAVGPNALALLNAMTGRPVFSLGADGEVTWDGRGDGKLARLRTGIGRLVVAAALPAETDPAWVRAAGFLWKMRRDQVEKMVVSGAWSKELDENTSNVYDYSDSYGVVTGSETALEAGTPGALASVQPEAVSELQTALLKGAKLLPFALVALILVVFIAIVGPGDCAVLGLFRIRRFTWILLPVVSVGVTWFTVRLAHEHMGGSDTRNEVVVVDVGADGTPLRYNRFELYYVLGRVEPETHIEGGLYCQMPRRQDVPGFTDVDGNEYEALAAYEYDYGTGGLVASEPVSYEGDFPNDYTMRQTINQWTPTMNRHFGFGDPGDTDAIHWEVLDDVDLLELNEDRLRELAPTILGRLADRSAVGIMYPGRPMTVFSGAGPDAPDVEKLVRDMDGFCRPRPRGLLSIVTCVSPAGSGEFDDMPVLDPSETEGTGPVLVVVVVPRGLDYYVYRRLYGGDMR